MELLKRTFGIEHYDNGCSIGQFNSSKGCGWTVIKSGFETKRFNNKQQAIKYAEKL